MVFMKFVVRGRFDILLFTFIMNLKNTNLEKPSEKPTSEPKETIGPDPAWVGCGERVGLEIWRINNFKVEHWPKADYGQFYDGDSYIILNTYNPPGKTDLCYDVHFWIGTHSTQDEYGTAAYKTVELDGYLEDKPIQHREVQGHESEMFKNYFPELMYMKGGCDSGFRKVEPEKYKNEENLYFSFRSIFSTTFTHFCLNASIVPHYQRKRLA